MNHKPLKILLSGGGTGGHIYPAITIADALKRRYPDAKFLFVGASHCMEMQKIPKANYAIKGMWISGLQRKLTFKNCLFPLKLLISLLQSFFILRNFRPDVVVGTGGFASGPVLYMAALKKIPTLIQEQNSYPGITNRLLAKKVNLVCVAYDGLERFFPKEKIIKTGNPVRRDLFDLEREKNKAYRNFRLDSKKQTLLVLGGSLGARSINETIERSILFLKGLNLQILWQTGASDYQQYQKYNSESVRVCDFIQAVNFAYAITDFAISRAGALAISELSLIGKPVILVPSPYLAEDHQTKNAMAVSAKNAALLLRQDQLKARFEKTFKEMFLNKEKQKNMGKALQEMAMPNATHLIVNHIIKLIENAVK